MMLAFLSEALAELCEAAEFYEGCEAGLGERFRREIEDLCRLMSRNPLLWRMRPGGYRRVNCPVFPYYLAYVIRDDQVVVIAVAHGHRRPEYWRDRLSEP